MKSVPVHKLIRIGLPGERFMKSDRKSVRGPCFMCGGSRRFVMFIDNPFPSWFGFCDICGWRGWADEINPKLRSNSKDELDQAIERRYIESELVREEEKRETLQEFRSARSWEEHHQSLRARDIKWWEKQGIPLEWQQEWQLGVELYKQYRHKGNLYECDAYTIPKFNLEGKAMNIDFRLADPAPGAGKYRPVYGLKAYPFIADTPKDMALIVEGSKKAMVTYLNQNQVGGVIGVPSNTSWANVHDIVKDIPITIVLFDPGAFLWANRLCTRIEESNGSRALVTTCPTKIDDAFLHYGMDDETFKSILSQARPAFMKRTR